MSDQLDFGFAAPSGGTAPPTADHLGESAQVGASRRARWAEACVAMSELMDRSRVAVLCQIRGVEEFYL